MARTQIDSFIDKIAGDVAEDKEAIEKLRRLKDADLMKDYIDLWNEPGLSRPSLLRQIGVPIPELFPPSEEPPPVQPPPPPPIPSERITALRPITELPPGFKMPVGELRPIVAYQRFDEETGVRERVPVEMATEEQRQTWTPIFQSLKDLVFEEPAEGIVAGFQQRRRAEATGLERIAITPIKGISLSASDIAAITVLGVAGVAGLQAGWRALTNLALMRQVSRFASERGAPISQGEAQTFANIVRNMARQAGQQWELDRTALRDFFKPTAGGRMSPSEAGVRQAEALAQRAVQQYAPALIPKGTQTGIAFGGTTREPLPPSVLSVASKIASKITLTPEEEQFRFNNKEAIETALRANAPVTKPAPAVEITAEVAQTWTEAGIQPSLLPEEIAAIEVRPPAKGKITQISMDDQLKLEQAKKAAEEALGETQEALEAQWEIEGLKAVHQVDPVAQWKTTERVTRKTKQPDGTYKLTEFTKRVGLDSFIPIRQTQFPDTLTVKQARMIWPGADYSRWLQKGTKEYNKVSLDVPLDPIASELGFTGTTAVNDLVQRINQIRKEKRQIREAQDTIKRQMTERPLPAVRETSLEELAEQGQMMGQPRYNLKQIDALIAPFAEYIMNPNTVTAYELARQTLSLQRSERFNNLKAKLSEIRVQTGVVTEEQARQIITDTLSGKYWVEMTDYLQFITGELRDAHFAKVAHVLKDYPAEYAGTITALVNALSGRPIPNIRPTPPPGGFKSVLWPQGASALDKLQYVFGKGTRHMKALEKMATEKKPLDEVVEGVFRETGQAPIPIDEEMAEYLRNLPTEPREMIRLGEKEGYLTFREAEDLTNRISNLKVEDQRTLVERIIEMRRKGLLKPPPVTPYEAPIEDAFRQGQLWPRPVRDNIVRALKELGMLPVDIGNFLRANKASVDFSFWRQQAPLIASHPISFAQANVEAWRAMWSQKSAEASWERITRDPLYQIYEEAANQGGDFLRPLVLLKGTSQYRGTEEYGYSKGVERLLPKLTAALPTVKPFARAFETGTNVHNWLIFKSYYGAMLRYGDQVASGRKKLKAGEAFDITKEMVDFSKSLANFSARGSLGKFAATAPALSGLFFAPRAAIGRILSVIDLINANPRVRLEAWKNAASFVGTLGGIVLLGAAMGWWEVEKDPRNAEYMSIRIGNTRLDPWGGYRQFLVFFARAINLTGVSSVTGAEYEVDPINLIQTFIRGKASPLASLILDFWRGKNFIGEEVDVANKAQWAERVAPFAVWDIYEAYKDDPIHAIQAAIPAIVGAGVQTYTGDWKENFPKLGLPKYSENLPYGLTEPKYDTADFWSDHAGDFKDVDPATLTAKKGFPEYIRAIAEAKGIKESLESLPSERLVSLNADPAMGTTFADYYKMWRDREVIVASGDEEKLKAFDQDERTRNANLGNFSQRQFALLNEYWLIADKKKQAEFLKQHEAEIGIKPRDEYLRTHPKENAQLAVWGQAKLLTKEAYNAFKSMVKDLDIPDSALPKLTLPPEGSLDTHWTYEEMVSAGTHGSWESQLLLKQDALKAKEDKVQSYVEWRTKEGEPLMLPDTPIASLELKTEKTYRETYNRTQAIANRASPDYIADERLRANERDRLRATKIPKTDLTYRDMERKIEAIEKGSDATPTSQVVIKAHIDYGRLIDKPGVGPNSNEVRLFRMFNAEYNRWRMNRDIWGDDALQSVVAPVFRPPQQRQPSGRQPSGSLTPDLLSRAEAILAR